MPLSDPQQQVLENWMRSKAIVQCPTCGDAQWQFAQAAYVRALLEQGESDMSEEKGVVKVGCGNCGYVMLLDAETVGIRGLWAEGREL
jgi:predicted nucleic-acid-binding Zn-ribbon protein